MAGDRRPVPNLTLNVWIENPGSSLRVELPDVVTDANGQYVLRHESARILHVSTHPDAEHRFICGRTSVSGLAPAPPPPALPLGNIELLVVHATWNREGLPPGIAVPGTSVAGTVSERVQGQLQPVPGATVTLDDEPPTMTSGTGFYLICSEVGTDTYRTISAHKPGFRTATQQNFGGWEPVADFELVRDQP